MARAKKIWYVHSMGFYVELHPTSSNEFREKEMPTSFWLLYSLCGFALVCMALSARKILTQMFVSGDWFDKTLVTLFISTIPVYLILGFKLFFLRKFIRWEPSHLEVGFYFLGRPFFPRRILKGETTDLELTNHRPTPNLASRMHNDGQYQIRGHWRLVLVARKRYVLDKSTDREALLPLQEALDYWRGVSAISRRNR